jgi:hypothetical protein
VNRTQGNARTATRFLALMPAVLSSEGRDYPCEAANLSRNGVLLLGDLPRPTHARAQLALCSPTGDLRMNLIGTLTRVEGDGPGASELAMQFCEVSPAEQAILESLISRVIEGATTVGTLGRLPVNASRTEIVETLKRIPLPHRVALATRAQPRERELLLNDTSPQVLEALVRNPHLSFREMQRILRMPTVPAAALEALARDSRFSDERARILIATHANTPAPLAESIALKLSPAALARLVQATSLNDNLRRKILRQLARHTVKAKR